MSATDLLFLSSGIIATSSTPAESAGVCGYRGERAGGVCMYSARIILAAGAAVILKLLHFLCVDAESSPKAARYEDMGAKQ